MLTIRFHRVAVSVMTACLLLTFTLTNTALSQSSGSEKEQALIAVLTSDAPKAEKAITCKSLAIYGSEAAVPELAKLLQDEELASWARIALEAIPGSTVDEALRNAAQNVTGNLLIGVINSIGVRRDEQAIDLLTVHLHDANVDVAKATANALGNIGNEAATALLRDALKESPPELQSEVAYACVKCAEKALAAGNDAKAVEIYDAVRAAELPQQRILEATRGAILARKAEGIPLLMEQLKSDNEAFFQLALGTAREIADPALDKALASAVDQFTPDKAALIIVLMADRPQTVDLNVVMDAAQEAPQEVRLAALAALGRVGNENSLSVLIESAKDDDVGIAQAARNALGVLPGENVNSEIKSRLTKAEGDIYQLLIEVVGERRIQAVPELKKALDHQDAAIRAAALTSLGTTVKPENLNVLIDQSINPNNADDRAVALQALKTASVRMPDREACAAELTAAVDRASGETKDNLLEIITEVGGTKALQTVAAAANSDDPQMQDTGSRLLGKWATTDAAPVLLDLAKTTSSGRYHTRAIRGYISLARRFATMPEEQRLEICRNTLEVARSNDDKKLVLEVLKLYPTIESLKLAINVMENPDLKEDAQNAALNIAPKIRGNQGQVKQIMADAGLNE